MARKERNIDIKGDASELKLLSAPLIPRDIENQEEEKSSVGWLQSIDLIQVYLKARSDIIYSKACLFMDKKGAIITSTVWGGVGIYTIVFGIIKHSLGLGIVGGSFTSMVPLGIIVDRIYKYYKFRKVLNQRYPYRPHNPDDLPSSRHDYDLDYFNINQNPDLWLALHSPIIASEVKELIDNGFFTLDPKETIETLLQKLIVASPAHEKRFGESLAEVLKGLGMHGVFQGRQPSRYILEYALEDQALAEALSLSAASL